MSLILSPSQIRKGSRLVSANGQACRVSAYGKKPFCELPVSIFRHLRRTGWPDTEADGFHFPAIHNNYYF